MRLTPLPRLLAVLLTSLSGALFAAAVQAAPSLIDSYTAEARQTQPGFQADAARGRQLFTSNHGNSPELPSCTRCHGNDPRQPGQHALTGKRIEPLAVVANPARFSDQRKSDKWFGRNCREVVGRDCTAAEKADVTRYLSQENFR